MQYTEHGRIIRKSREDGDALHEIQWVLCPICHNKTRLKIRRDTVLINFPLYCPKCKQETLITAHHMNITVIKEPDAETQSR